MNNHPYGDLKNGNDVMEPFDDKMQQIRDLLFGEFKRDSDQRLALIEARVRELEQGVHRKLDAIQARLESMSTDVVADRRRSFEELSRQVVELGERIGKIGGEDH
ncbi:MAG: hypothetical protein R3D67_08695 [Hyphomicrobiaceae bacterium]